MAPGRLLLVGAGVGIAAVAIFFVARGLRGVSSVPRADATGAAQSGAGQGDQGALPLWRDFVRAGDPATTIPRLVEGIEIAFVSPFDRAYAFTELEKSDLRLDGVAPGDSAVALLSGKVVRVGDTIGAFRISRIDSSGVVLLGPAGVRLELTLGTSVLSATSKARPPPQGQIGSGQTASRRGGH